jgi:hypothetical protein
MKRTHLMVGITLSTLSTMAMASAPDTEAVEFYNALNKHYFITATASEARIIDSGGAGEGWMRTGRSFQAWLKKADAPATAQPVCRFYSSGANSHFYTAGSAECEGLKSSRSGWQYEGIAFHIQVPVNGQCPADTVELLRVYNNGFSNGEGANHRFVDDASLKELMVESHWIAEGTAFCAASKSTGTSANLRPTSTSFETLLGTWKGDANWEVANRDSEGEHETSMPLELKIAADGAITGTGNGCSFTGKVDVGDGFRSLFVGTVTASGCTDAAFNGEYRRLKLQRFGTGTLMVKMKRGDENAEVSISARLTNDAATSPPVPAPVSGLEGEWVGTVGWDAESPDLKVEVNKPLSLTISSTGTISGTGFGCTFTGAVGGNVVAAGCENAIFNGTYPAVRVKRDGSGKIEISFKRQSAGTEIEIEGELFAKDHSTAPTPAPVDAVLTGQWEGRVSWSAGSASGSDTIRFTIGADGAFSGTGFGCTLTGTLKLSLSGRAVTSGTITASSCTQSALSVTFSEVEFERDGSSALEFGFTREVGGVKVRVKGTVKRVG